MPSYLSLFSIAHSNPTAISARRIAQLLVVGCALAVSLSGCQAEQAVGQTQPQSPPPSPVTVVTLQPTSVTLTVELPGRVQALRKAEVRPQVSGILEKRLFDEGTMVQAGQPLYQIAAATYQAAVQTAEAHLARAQAQLDAAQARETRHKNLLQEKAVSQQQYDDVLATLRQAKAEVAVANAALQTAQINLTYTQVLAPISGRIGKSEVTEGALVTAQQATSLAVIHQLDPIYVDMAQASSRVLDIRRQLLNGDLTQAQMPQVQLTLEDGSLYDHVGKLQFADMSVSESTGTLIMRARFANPDHLLLPGMFARAELQEGTRQQALLVPQRGVSRDREGRATALVVNGDNQVELRQLEVSRALGNQWLVETGLQPGDRVIVEGLQKIAPGAQVLPTEVAGAVAQTGG